MKDLLSRNAYPVMFEVGAFEYVETDGPMEITGDQVASFQTIVRFTPLNVTLDETAAWFLENEILPRIEGFYKMVGAEAYKLIWAGNVVLAMGMN